MAAKRQGSDFCAAHTVAARVAIAEGQLAALNKREPTIRAFVCCDVHAARRGIASTSRGALSGALIGVKDIIATADFPTRYGAPDGLERGPRHDAWCVAEAKRLGATVLGKTVCTEFAYPMPGPTINPHDPRRTPGGSSSGSAAAVAAGFVSFALGSQTAGSVIRPASYCGVTGYKPSHGLLSTEGVQAISATLDHIGVFARSPRDAWYFASAMVLREAETVTAHRPRRLLVLRLPAEIPQEDGYPKLFHELVAALRREGISVETIHLPFPVADFANLQKELCYWELARILRVAGPVRVMPELETLLQPYRGMDIAPYAAACRRRLAHQTTFETLAADCDAVLMPAATGAAPPREDTGDAVMSRFWTALHVPAMAVPFWSSPAGIPLGLQVVGRFGTDPALAAVAQWFFENALTLGGTPPQLVTGV